MSADRPDSLTPVDLALSDARHHLGRIKLSAYPNESAVLAAITFALLAIEFVAEYLREREAQS